MSTGQNTALQSEVWTSCEYPAHIHQEYPTYWCNLGKVDFNLRPSTQQMNFILRGQFYIATQTLPVNSESLQKMSAVLPGCITSLTRPCF